MPPGDAFPRMAASASTTTPLGDAIGDVRVDRVLEEFSTSKGGYFGYRIQPTAFGRLPPAREARIDFPAGAGMISRPAPFSSTYIEKAIDEFRQNGAFLGNAARNSVVVTKTRAS
jgi:hypothetical protein